MNHLLEKPSENETSDKIPFEVVAKQFYDAIKTDELFLVEVKNNEVYVVMQ